MGKEFGKWERGRRKLFGGMEMFYILSCGIFTSHKQLPNPKRGICKVYSSFIYNSQNTGNHPNVPHLGEMVTNKISPF